MLIDETTMRVIYFRPHDARTVEEGCYYLDHIDWFNAGEIEEGNDAGFSIGCSVNGYGCLTFKSSGGAIHSGPRDGETGWMGRARSRPDPGGVASRARLDSHIGLLSIQSSS
jgi:hypothetical protein